MRKSNYDKYPATEMKAKSWIGWDSIKKKLEGALTIGNAGKRVVMVVECYQGVIYDELQANFGGLRATKFIDTATLMKSDAEIRKMTYPFLTDDRLFGYKSRFAYADFFDAEKLNTTRKEIDSATGSIVVFGHGAAEVAPQADILVYADMARWEIQQRSRRHQVNGLGVANRKEAPSEHYKRGYFVDWGVCDAMKKKLLSKIDFLLDTHTEGRPKMIEGATLREGLNETAKRPFRVVPFFDPAPWGGQWMKDVCDLDRNKENYGWCFDCVPEENSLYFKIDGELIEMAANNLVFYKTTDLLGSPVEARFGADFPIRFDFLDTIGGGSLSLQVHPTTQYIRDTFGVSYTQDESYYILDAEAEGKVYLGLKTGTNPEEFVAALKEAQKEGGDFDAEKYINLFPARKHDHFLIPGGTLHCSGTGAMVLEISATPNYFTFKLWDWGRMGLDGKPRPINIDHGAKVIDWSRQTEFTERELASPVQHIAEGHGWREERTGLHKNEFIETRRHWFTKSVPHNTNDGVNVFNLVEGEEVAVESPTGAFEPFVVHYAETFIIPASVGDYTIRPCGKSEGKECATIKAYVRFR